MYPINTTEFFGMPYPVFDNQTVFSMSGYLNQTTPIYLNSTGYVSAVVDVRGLDMVILLLVAILIFQIAIFSMLLWEHYRSTWGGKKYL